MCVSKRGSHLEVSGIGTKHISVQGLAHLVHGRLPPAAGMVTKRTVLIGRTGDGEAGRERGER